MCGLWKYIEDFGVFQMIVLFGYFVSIVCQGCWIVGYIDYFLGIQRIYFVYCFECVVVWWIEQYSGKILFCLECFGKCFGQVGLEKVCVVKVIGQCVGVCLFDYCCYVFYFDYLCYLVCQWQGEIVQFVEQVEDLFVGGWCQLVKGLVDY